MLKCCNCHENMAVIFINDDKDNNKLKGYCLSCAKKMDLKGIDDILLNQGINDDNVDEITKEINNTGEMLDGMDFNGINNLFKEIVSNDEFKKAINEIPNLLHSMSDKKENIANEDNDDNVDEKKSNDDEKKKDNNGKRNIFEVNIGSFNPFSKNSNSNENFSKSNKKYKNLEKYGVNLTKLAKEGKIDPIIGRNKEISRVIEILNRRNKNNPVLIGEAGVGKTSIAKGLANKIVSGEIPQKLKDYEIVEIDMSSIVSGTSFRGQFESRMKNIIDEAIEHGKIILVIDEMHNIVGAGDNTGAMDAANLLKPFLERGQLKIIGATTIREYRKYIEKDKALDRRLQSILIEEPNEEETIEILKGLRKYYENYHKIIITDEIIEKTVKLSKRYIHDRYLPDKAIDIIDEAGSKVNLNNRVLNEIDIISKKIDDIQLKKEEANKNQDYEKLANYKTLEIKEKEKLEKLKENEYIKLNIKNIADVIESWTKIPVNEITENESKKLINLENKIKESIIGQDEAVKLVANAIKRKRTGITDFKKPNSFIFVGPTGVGKTKLVKTLAKELFGSEDEIVRVDMSEYMEKHSVSKLIGAPPGYVGHDDTVSFVDKIKVNPYSVVLLDEIEKAHSDVFNILLQILDDGRLTDSKGNVINFEHTIIIMTSNIGTSFISNTLGFENLETENIKEKERIKDELKKNFKPEFLNRIDDIVIFNELNKNKQRKILDILLKELSDILKEKKVELQIEDNVKDFILEKGYNQKFGARPLKRTIQNYIENGIADIFIVNDIEKINSIHISLKDEKLYFSKN